MRKIALVLLLAAATGVQAQDPNEVGRRVYQLKYADAHRVASLLLGTGRITIDEGMRAISVEALKSRFDEYDIIIKRFDVPPPAVQNIEVTIYLMSALGQPSATPIPPELEGVVKQLRATFAYKGYQLIDAQQIRVRAGQGGDASGVIDGGTSDGPKTISQVKFGRAVLSTDEKGRAIRIDGLKVGLRVPVVTGGGANRQYTYFDNGISTDVDVREGQKVVVGKANMDGGDRASIVVLMAKVVE